MSHLKVYEMVEVLGPGASVMKDVTVRVVPILIRDCLNPVFVSMEMKARF